MEVVEFVADAILSSGAKIEEFSVDLEESYVEDWDGLHVKAFAKHYLSLKYPRLTFAHLRGLDLTLQNVKPGHKYASKLINFFELLPLLQNLTLRWVNGSLFADGAVDYLTDNAIFPALVQLELQIIKLSVQKLLRFIRAHSQLGSLTLREVSLETGEDWQEFFESLKESHGGLSHLEAVSVSCARWLQQSTARKPGKLLLPKEEIKDIDKYVSLVLESLATQAAEASARDDSDSSSDSDSDSSDSTSSHSVFEPEAEEIIREIIPESNRETNEPVPASIHDHSKPVNRTVQESTHDSVFLSRGEDDFMRHVKAWVAWKGKPTSALIRSRRRL
jgi:hypothetical protein